MTYIIWGKETNHTLENVPWRTLIPYIRRLDIGLDYHTLVGKAIVHI